MPRLPPVMTMVLVMGFRLERKEAKHLAQFACLWTSGRSAASPMRFPLYRVGWAKRSVPTRLPINISNARARFRLATARQPDPLRIVTGLSLPEIRWLQRRDRILAGARCQHQLI